ncbi:MAG: helix-turn-helix domain-containing protein [Paludibacteraceae bacterium]|nr:helix-turn-helix domain-containing protein [Paludibacteraceae bacterium]
MYEFYFLGNMAMSVYWLIYGVITGIIISMAVFMFWSSRTGSSFVQYPTSRPLRRAAGVIFTVAGIEVLVALGIIALLGDKYPIYDEHWCLTTWGSCCLQQFLALMFVPAVCNFMQAVLQGGNRFNMRSVVFAILFPAVLFVWTIVYGIHNVASENVRFSKDVLFVVRVYWVVCVLAVFYFYTKDVKRYEKHLCNMYSDFSNRHVRWLYILGVLNVVYVVWFVAVCTTRVSFLFGAMVEHVLALGITIYTYYHVDRQQLIKWDTSGEDSMDIDPELPILKELDAKVNEWLEGKGYLNADLTRDDLVRELKTNRTYLNMYFASKGISFYKFINFHRIKYATMLLAEESNLHKLSDIAATCGFKSLEVFSRQFKLVSGCLPSQFRGGGA